MIPMEKEEALSCFEYVFAGRTNKHHIMLGSFSTEDNVGLERSVLRNAKKTKNAAELSSSRSKHFSLFFHCCPPHFVIPRQARRSSTEDAASSIDSPRACRVVPWPGQLSLCGNTLLKVIAGFAWALSEDKIIDTQIIENHG